MNGISSKSTCTVAVVSCLVDLYSRTVGWWMYLNPLEMRRSPCQGCGAFVFGPRDGRQCLDNVTIVLMQAIRRSRRAPHCAQLPLYHVRSINIHELLGGGCT